MYDSEPTSVFSLAARVYRCKTHSEPAELALARVIVRYVRQGTDLSLNVYSLAARVYRYKTDSDPAESVLAWVLVRYVQQCTDRSFFSSYESLPVQNPQ
jgi:hypothetical protein